MRFIPACPHYRNIGAFVRHHLTLVACRHSERRLLVIRIDAWKDVLAGEVSHPPKQM